MPGEIGFCLPYNNRLRVGGHYHMKYRIALVLGVCAISSACNLPGAGGSSGSATSSSGTGGKSGGSATSASGSAPIGGSVAKALVSVSPETNKISSNLGVSKTIGAYVTPLSGFKGKVQLNA